MRRSSSASSSATLARISASMSARRSALATSRVYAAIPPREDGSTRTTRSASEVSRGSGDLPTLPPPEEIEQCAPLSGGERRNKGNGDIRGYDRGSSEGDE